MNGFLFHMRRKRSQSGSVQSGECSKNGSSELRRAWNRNQCYCLCFPFREPGSPLPSTFFPFLCPSIRPSLLRARWHHEELEIMNTTTLTHRPHSTRVYYRTTIFQPNTLNGDSKGLNREVGRERRVSGVGEEEEGNNEKWNTSSPMPTFVIDAYKIPPLTITTWHSHCLLNLVFTEKYRGRRSRGVGSGSRDVRGGNILLSTQKNNGSV